jgi:chromosomal replication initiator protein
MPELNYSEIWQRTLDLIEESGRIDQQTMKNWLRKTTLFKIEGQDAFIAYQSVITLQMLNSQKGLFASTLGEIIGLEPNLHFIEQKEMEKMLPEVRVETKTNQLLENKFNEAYTFDSFVEGNSNREAYASCLQACNQSFPIFNPLMLYGNSGLGKTHLLHAVGNYLKKEKPEAKVIYMYSGDFVTLLIEAMKTKNVHGNTVEIVKEQLLDCDYFLIDDIQNLKNQSSQEVFFTVYNKLIQKGAQIIITSDIHPQNLSNLQDRLVSRFTQGLSINISKPEFETSTAILRKKLEGREESVAISDEVIDYLALTFSHDVRNLEGTLNRLLFNATLFNPDVIDVNFAKTALKDESPAVEKNGELTVRQIKKSVIHYYGLTYKDLEGKSRQKMIATARHICVYLCRTLLEIPYASIGQELGNRDHKTITSSYQKACSLLETDAAFKMAVDKIKEGLE